MGTDTRRSGADDDESSTVTRRELHGRERPHWRRRLVMGLVAVLVLIGSGTAFVVWRLSSNITKIDVSEGIGTDRPEQVAGTGDAVNLLLIGSDTRQGDGNDAYGDNDGTTGEAHSDTNLLVHVSADRTWATVVSIPRDSMTPAPPDCSPTAPKSEWDMRMWNQNYRIGGTGCLIRTVEGNTGLRIDHYAVVDFRGFKTMVDALGGVDVCTSEPIDDKNTHLVLAAGRHTLDGRQALQYVRVRKSVGDGSDLGRIERQQAFLSSVMQEATSTKLLFQPTKLFSFLDAATKSLTTDPEFGLGTMQDLATSVRGIGLDEIQFVTVPNEAYPADLNRVQWKDSAKQIWKALREDQQLGAPKKTATPTPTPSPTAEPLSASPDEISVRVVNSSGVPGLARQARDALAVQGFVGVTTSDGTTGPTGALVEYSGDRAEQARTVAAAFPGAEVKKTPGLGSTVRVTLGSDAPAVVELPNRIGDDPLPTPTVEPSPSPTESIPTRKATTDICS